MIKKRGITNTKRKGASITISSINHQPNQISELPTEVPKSKARITKLMNSLKKIKSVKSKSDTQIKVNTDELEKKEDQYVMSLHYNLAIANCAP